VREKIASSDPRPPADPNLDLALDVARRAIGRLG
jgi:hypothetical protein